MAYLRGAPLDATIARLEAWQPQMAAYLDSYAPPIDQPPIDPPPTTGFPSHRMGVHWIPGSNRAGDHAYMRGLGAGAIKAVTLDINRLNEAQSYLDRSPRSVLVIRDHPLSEQKADMVADPVGTGKRHAREWLDKLQAGRFNGIDMSRAAVCGINEPFVHNAEQERGVVAYTMAFLEDLRSYGLRGLALNLSVGWPRNSDTATVKNTKPLWDNFLPLEDVINRGNHFLCLHEYWRNDPDDSWYEAPNGEKWGWHAHRHWACPMSVPIIIGECGLTKEVGGKPAPGQSVGWIGNVSPETYAEQLWRYADKCHPNVFAVMPFTTDMASADWAMDDTAMAHEAILARKHATTWPTPWPVPVTPLPPIEPPEEEVKTIVWPKMDRISGHYGDIYTNKFGTYAHEGLDISRVTGTPIFAPYDGIVAWSDVEPTSYGEYVRTYHPELKICAFYGHLSERLVKTGNSVRRGQLLGYTGDTGNSSAPHLHFEIRKMTDSGRYMPNYSAHGNARVDPLGFLAGWLAAGNLVEYK